MNWQELIPNRNDRAVFIGATGCGKTTLARYLLNDSKKPYVVVYDAKHSENISEWKEFKFFDDFGEIVDSKTPKQIYRPSIYEMQDAQSQDAFFEWVYFRRNTRLYVDEAYALLGGTNPSFHLQACLTRGREKGISTFISTQRPKRIPLITLSESEHFYIFRLTLNEDKERVYELTNISIQEQIELRPYEFIYYNALTGHKTGKLKLNL